LLPALNRAGDECAKNNSRFRLTSRLLRATRGGKNSKPNFFAISIMLEMSSSCCGANAPIFQYFSLASRFELR
jgi:hypothetical protein